MKLICARRLPLPVFVVQPYSLWNAQISYRSDGGDWALTLAARNLTDRFRSFQKLSGTLTAQTHVGPPREVSLEILNGRQ